MKLNLKLKTNKVTDDTLIAYREEILSILTAGKGTSIDPIINLLLEIERELTLRETY